MTQRSTRRFTPTLRIGAAVAAIALLTAGCATADPEPELTNVVTAPTEIPTAEPTPEAIPGFGPACPETRCITLTVSGDLLFHEGLWNQFRTDPAVTGTDFDFVPLLAGQQAYLDRSDISVCDMETPLAPQGGPYAAYPIFNTPPALAAAVKAVGYDACTVATNHTLDQGVAGIEQTRATLEAAGLAHTGANLTEEESWQPLLLEAPGGTLGLITGTVSLNGMEADTDWRVDRLREGEWLAADVAKMVTKADTARAEGADVVAVAMHSIQEYLDVADTWQVSAAHALADTGKFDVIYGHGCHCTQPFEFYNNTWIIYGLGNTVTESAPPERFMNNEGLLVRIQFAGSEGGDWYVSNLSWVGSSNTQDGVFRWCSVAHDAPQGICRSPEGDAAIRDRAWTIIGSLGAFTTGTVTDWLVSTEPLG